MATPPPVLDDLRREIDAIDDAMHDLIMRRASVVETIGTVKRQASADGIAIRPAREAMIVRRLLDKHAGAFPAIVLVRMWRELLAGTTRMQGPFSVAVHAPEKSVGYWDLARDHYGSCTRMTLHQSAQRVVREVAQGHATIGVLAMPNDGQSDPWWPFLVASEAGAPRIVACLPFLANDAGRFEDLKALAIARAELQPTGDDVSLVAVEANLELSRARLRDILERAGLKTADMAVTEDANAPDQRLHLIRIEGFVESGDPRLAELQSLAGKAVRRVIGLGGYAAPIDSSV